MFSLKVATADKVVPKIHNGYAWFVANISNDAKPNGIIRRGSNRETTTLMSLLLTLESNLIGIVTVTMSLKRVLEDGELKYGLSLSLKALQMTGKTNVGSFLNDYRSRTDVCHLNLYRHPLTIDWGYYPKVQTLSFLSNHQRV